MKKEMKPVDTRKAGWFLMAGAVAFVFGMCWETSIYDLWILGFPLLLLSVSMMAFGLKGLQARYGQAVDNFEKNILQIRRHRRRTAGDCWNTGAIYHA